MRTREEARIRAHLLRSVGCGVLPYGVVPVDREGPWLNYARQYADIARDGLFVRQWRLSLYNGLAGVFCLMLDMLDPDRAAQPCIAG